MFDPHLQLLPKTNVRYALTQASQARKTANDGRAIKLMLAMMNDNNAINKFVENLSESMYTFSRLMVKAAETLGRVLSNFKREDLETGLSLKITNQ